MYTRFAKVLLALGLADVGYLNVALGPELFPSIAEERAGEEPSTTRAALRDGEPYRARSEPAEPADITPATTEGSTAPWAPTLDAPPAPEVAAPSAATSTTAPEAGEPLAGAPLDDTTEASGEIVVRFPETAATALTEDARAELRSLARQLRDNPDQRLRVVGHADARGSRGFNRYLGARRARAVTEALLAAGVARRQLQVLSRGEDDPRVDGEDEAAWAQNRRVEISMTLERSNTP
jgi:peptidoglycan-associated lipoprotein